MTSYSFVVTVTGSNEYTIRGQEYVGTISIDNNDEPKEIARLIAFKLFKRDYPGFAVKSMEVCYCVKSGALNKYAAQWTKENK